MGVIGELVSTLFGSGRNVVAETVDVFRENAENGAKRDTEQVQAALTQFAAEFAFEQKSNFDKVIDGLNRIPRPAMALGTLGLFVSAMVDPIWFASRMQGIALVPEPLWWLLGAIVGFYFGARHQAKGQDFQRSIATTLARAGQVTQGISVLRALQSGLGAEVVQPAETNVIGGNFLENAALAEWKNAHS
ncbi:holin family protein [Aliiruegeria lutimaris]|uniref:Holin of 3TMs, for gene-transfer release n=1 Tax=Aliiruegeria lutimaris TaxID=571298 RepID=A0A1G8ZJJ8_9RHOB|nr:holin family protein [Aliiruegeria lutimaris]SDK14310.1 Holin of 3TMs, for gene-transfer release [Aliiruegeria lutimaris]